MTGKLITIYGINNIGKSTHAKSLVEHLQKIGKRAMYIKYPVYDIKPTGTFLNKTLRRRQQKISEEELQMWFTLNRYQYQPVLQDLLKKGVWVVAEDYIGTGIAWGTSKGLDRKWLEELNKYLIKEDLAIFIDGARRMDSKEKKHIHEQNDSLVEKCKSVHQHLSRLYGWQKVILRDKKEDTYSQIWQIVEKFLL